MEPGDKADFGDLLEATMATYGRDLSTSVLRVWWEALRPYELKTVRYSLSAHLQDVDVGQFPPKPSDIIRRIQGGTTTDRAFVAWSMVDRAIRHVGGFESVVFDDHLIHFVIDQMGGWVKLCDTDEDELPFRAQEFQKRYRGAWHNPPESFPGRLVGRIEHHNRQKGFLSYINQPILIGSPEKCQQVLESGTQGRRLKIQRAKDVVKQLGYEPKG